MLAGGAQDLPWNRERSGELLSALSACLNSTPHSRPLCAACNRCLVTSLLLTAPMSPRVLKTDCTMSSPTPTEIQTRMGRGKPVA